MYSHHQELIGYAPNPNLPWDYYENGLGGSYGATPAELLLRGLGAIGMGGVAGQAGQDFLASPQVQRQLEEFQVECKTRAKEGVTEWMKENAGVLIAGGAALVGLNYLMLAFAVLPVVRPRKR